MPIEFVSLVLMTIFFTLAWLPASVGKTRSYGLKWLASNRERVQKELLPWAARCERAHQNLKDYFPAFVVAIVLLGFLHKFDHTTQIASVIFLIARIGHFVSYAFGNVNLRAGFFFLGLLSNLYLLVKILF